MRNILLIKEEGDTSQRSQAYDQAVAKADKAYLHQFLDLAHPKIGIMSQWQVIAVCLMAFKKVKPDTWISSFRHVNLHPCFRRSFHDWCEEIKDALHMGENFFVDCSQGLFDAMPAVWKKLSPDIHLTLVNRIDVFHAEASPGQSSWVKDTVLQLTKYVPLDQIPNIRACYMATKIDPSVVHRLEEAQPHTEDLDEPSIEPDLAALNAFQLKPPSLMNQYMSNKARPCEDQDDTIQNNLWKHMTNFAARQSWKSGTMAPSAHFNVEVTKDQEDLLNPSPCNMIMGFVMYDVKGTGAKKHMAK